MSALIPFQFGSQEVRVVTINGEPLFSARDVALALGYENPSKAYQDHCKWLKKLSYNESLELGFTNPNPQGEYVMPEGDVYRLAAKSRLESAQRFEAWVYDEVLPAIRKTGSYALPNLEPPKQRPLATDTVLQLPACIDAIKAIFPNLGENSLQALAGDICELDLGRRLIPLPVIKDKFYTATELAEEFGVSAQKVGRIATAFGLKTEEHGEHRLSKSKYSSKQVEQFYYNEKGRQALAMLFAETAEIN